MDLPQRRVLGHTPPSFVASGEIFFLTICGEPRGTNQFADDSIWPVVRDAAAFQHQHGRWHVRLLLAMPDHLHVLASFPLTSEMRRVVSDREHFLARKAGIAWQRDFFDHRLRTHRDLDEKACYIRLNPVRAGLAARKEDWAFVWSPPDIVANPFR